MEENGATPAILAPPLLGAVGDLVARGHTGDVALSLDFSGHITGWNTRALAALGYSQGELRGRHISLLNPPEDASAANAHLAHALQYGKASLEGWCVRKDGSRFWARIATAPVSHDGEHAGFAMVLAGLRSTARLQSVLETVGCGVVTLDEDGIIHSLNPAGEQLLGYRESELVGQSIGMTMGEERLAHMNAVGARAYLRARIPELLDGGRTSTGRRNDGTTFPIRVQAADLQLGGRRYFTLAFEDITAQTQMETELRQAQKMQEVGLLAGGVAHDFNNLLTVIQGYCDVLLLEMDPADRHRPEVEAILAASARASGLTRQLLAFSRKSAMQMRITSLNDVVLDAEKILQRIIGENIRFETNLAVDLHPVEVDTGQLGQVLINLAVNARDAMPGGGVIRFETMNVALGPGSDPELRAGNYVLLRVHDTGAGMPPSVLARVFEPFFTTKHEGHGTGLGLPVVHGIIRQCGGVIRVASTEGKGSVFSVFLPSAAEARDDDTETMPAHEAVPAAAKILLAEDEDAVRTVARLILERQGYQVLVAPDGEDALTLFAEHRDSIGLLVTDIMMPRMGGRELAEAALEQRPGLPVLFISGYPDDAAIDQHFAESPVFFLSKPFTPRELTAQIQEALNA